MSGKVLVACELSQVVCSTVRSRSFPCFAHAMANQWRGFVET